MRPGPDIITAYISCGNVIQYGAAIAVSLNAFAAIEDCIIGNEHGPWTSVYAGHAKVVDNIVVHAVACIVVLKRYTLARTIMDNAVLHCRMVASNEQPVFAVYILYLYAVYGHIMRIGAYAIPAAVQRCATAGRAIGPVIADRGHGKSMRSVRGPPVVPVAYAGTNKGYIVVVENCNF